MRKRTLRLVVSAIAGALTGAVLVFLLLAAIGTRNLQQEDTQGSPSPPLASSPSAPSPEPLPTVSPAPSPASSPTADVDTAAADTVVNKEGKYQFSLPAGYRVAKDITNLERSQAPAAASLTITKGSTADEREYVRLIGQLRQDQTATEAPVFLPGGTMTLLTVTGANLEASDAQLARSKETITTTAGYPGTRYRRVEGLFTYDMAYVKLPGGTTVAVQMSYAPEEPLFDERAYQAVLNSLKSL